MPCYKPIRAWRSKKDKKAYVFKASEGIIGTDIDFACGRCIGCRIERSREWAVRIMHEATVTKSCCFLTLTYDNTMVPYTKGGLQTLNKRDLTLFFKKLRNKVGKVRYYACGEYGNKLGRPHYHICLFGYSFPDKKTAGVSDKGNQQYSSSLLNEIWRYGLARIGVLNFESAQYCAKYCTKLVSGERKEAHYNGRTPEYSVQSNRPGIGRPWFDRYKMDIYRTHTLTLRNGIVTKIPRIYDTWMAEETFESNIVCGKGGKRHEIGRKLTEFDKLKEKRKENVNPEKSTQEYLYKHKQITEHKIKLRDQMLKGL